MKKEYLFFLVINRNKGAIKLKKLKFVCEEQQPAF